MQTHKSIITTIILIISLLATTKMASAGDNGKFIEFGIKAGLQSQTLKMSKDDALGLFSTDSKMGYQFGAMARINVLGFFAQPEIVYSSHRFDLDMEGGITSKVTMRNTQVPVLIGAQIAFLRIYVGPVFNLMTDTSNKPGKTSPAINTQFYKSAVGYNLGVALDLGKINLDLRYGSEFKAPVQTITQGVNEARSVNTKIRQWQFNLGYFF